MEGCSSGKNLNKSQVCSGFPWRKHPKLWSGSFSSTTEEQSDIHGNIKADGTSWMRRRPWWAPVGCFWTPHSWVRLLRAFPGKLWHLHMRRACGHQCRTVLPMNSYSPITLGALCLFLKAARSLSKHPLCRGPPHPETPPAPGWMRLQPQQRSGSRMTGTRGMCWASLEQTVAALTMPRQRRNIFQIFPLYVMFLLWSARAFSCSSAPSEYSVIWSDPWSWCIRAHAWLWPRVPLPLHLFFFAFLGLFWSSPRKALQRISGPKGWPHHGPQPQKEGSTGLSPIRIEILACTADNKFLVSLIFCILQREQDWADWIYSKGESNACAVLVHQCLALNPPNNYVCLL